MLQLRVCWWMMGADTSRKPAVAWAELRALFPDRGVNGFPYWVVREERRRFFKHSVSEN